ncbi:MAG: hypothetical protein GX565_02210 [Lentisphaerae bacterium]|jgi:hypothetical protein|nr:hypothetical protein [Lentisphaerota bacterium]
MSESDAPKNRYLEICAESIEKRFGNFHTGHPREVLELLHLFVRPSARLKAEIFELRFFKLGNIADL